MEVTAKVVDDGIVEGRKEQIVDSSKSSSQPRESIDIKEEKDELESTRAEISEVKQENERLRTALSQVIMDYRSLQTQFSDIIHKEQDKSNTTTAQTKEEDESALVSLSLGASASASASSYIRKEKEKEREKGDVKLDEGLELGLNCGFDKTKEEEDEKESVEEIKEEKEGEEGVEEEKKEGWATRKILKKERGREDQEEDLQYNPVKKARVSVRARCDGVMMNDGCQWRKYGQKIAKGNPCPRSYYRCTVGPGCPVRKQVQRCADDMSILTTTYEGKHNHPLPPAAASMVATTSSAMNMLLSGSSTSRPGVDAAAATANLSGLNFSLSDNSRARQYLSISPSHPTITLDLTSPESSTSQAMQTSRLSTNFTSPGPRYYPTNFNYPSLESTTSMPPWSSPYLSYYGTQLHGSKSQLAPLNVGGAQTQESFYKSSLQKLSNNAPSTAQNSLTDTITAATKAITSDPSFQSALVATVASVLGGKGNQDTGEGMSQTLKRGDHLSSILPYSSSWKGNLPSHQPSFAFSNHKSSSSPPVERE